ncbi:D-xylose ABC transporter ATP-binding protein [Priestia megaterium]|uniref:sugar ABC transporter ATP-binding protein n=1 Tax=Priestia megaterium TaxID=1404 RepID=UPI000BFC5858|nr:sugar ABC transporter ATP-binding protein [Priestia megaterium]PGN53186.1 D-xylose ABC transporter ATP-binding protein [Priestia megaterium]PGQ87611.1 D-xylose ABC transporter ATP-binding protein [Priestia megaterium]
MPNEIILELKNIKKFFGNVAALSGVNLKIKKGQVHTLLGGNGAGKSTLMKIVSGVHQPDEGEIILNGENIRLQNPKDAQERGISIIYQELSLCPNLSVAENIFADREPMNGIFINKRKLKDITMKLLQEIEMNLSPTTLVKDLSISQQQMVEIAKAISFQSEVIIMDEPTSALSSRETEVLFNIIDKLKAKGVAIIYISHRMDELLRISDEITVMRDGAYVATVKKNEANMNNLIKMMIGRELNDIYPKRDYNLGTETLLEVSDYTKKGWFEQINLQLKQGEILGIFGLMGAGRSELAQGIFGITNPETGTMKIKGKEVKIKNPQDAIKNKIAFITENRKEQGLVTSDTVKRNITMLSIDKLLSKFGLIDDIQENEVAKKAILNLNVKTSSIHQTVNNLSGGNQQKIVLAKWLETNPDILILDEPTRGIDISSKNEIYRLMRQLARKGVGIIMISSELSEVLFMSDRMLIMRDKKLVTEVAHSKTTQDEVMLYATGGK